MELCARVTKGNGNGKSDAPAVHAGMVEQVQKVHCNEDEDERGLVLHMRR